MTTLHEAFRARRVALGMSQAAVAASARLSRKTVSDFENGRASLSIANLARLLATAGLELAVREASRRPTLDELQRRLAEGEPETPPRKRVGRSRRP